MKGTLVTVLGAAVCVAALAAWFYVAPAAGSGWILFVVFLGTMGLLNSINDRTLGTIAGLVITVAAGATWFLGQALPNSGWVGFLAILAALGTFHALNSTVSANTANSTRKNKKK